MNNITYIKKKYNENIENLYNIWYIKINKEETSMVKFANDIIKEIKIRGSIEVPKGYITGESFEKWLCAERQKGVKIDVNSTQCRTRT